MDAIRLFPIVQPSYANVDGILADVRARKNEEKWKDYNKQLTEKIQLRDYQYEIYVKKAHENIIRMEVSMINTIDAYV